jgi:hypothetical protein
MYYERQPLFPFLFDLKFAGPHVLASYYDPAISREEGKNLLI